MNFITFSMLLLLVLGVALQNGIYGTSIAKRSTALNSRREDFHAGYIIQRVTNSSSSATVAIAGQNRDTNTSKHYQHIVYVSADSSRDSIGPTFELGGGLYRTSGQVKDIFRRGTRRDGDYDIEALAVRGEFGTGAMGRAKLFDATVNTGHVGFNVGVTADTGAILKNDALEVKVLGFGGSIGKHGIQICFIICLGINW